MQQVIDFGFIFNDRNRVQELADLIAEYHTAPYWTGAVKGNANRVADNRDVLVIDEVGDEDHTIEQFVMTREDFLQGLVQYAIERVFESYDFWDSDNITQLAIFGEQRYS